MNCEQAEELLGAYALDALPDDEAAAFRAHLAGCARHAADARELREVADRLPSLAEPVTPPPELRARVLAAVAVTPREASEATTRLARPRSRINWRPSATSGDGGGRVVQFPRVVLGAIAAAVLVAFGGLAAWNVALMNDDGAGLSGLASRATLVAPLTAHGAQGSGTVLYFEGEHKAVVVVDGLAAAGPGRTYQVWAIVEGRAESLGVMQPDASGHMAGVVGLDARAATQVAITIEPAGGSPQPTADPVFIAEV